MNNKLTRLIVESLRAFQVLVLNYSESVSKHPQSQQDKTKQQPPPLIVQTTLELPIEVTEYCKSHAQEKPAAKAWRWIKNILEIIAVGTAIILVCLTNMTLRQVKRQADTASDNLIAENRPWVTAAVSLEEPPNSHSPKPGLTFNSDGSASFNCFIVVKNIGKSIATGIFIRAKIYPPPLRLFSTDPVNKEKALCNEVRAEKRDTNRLPSLFPGEESYEPEAIPMSKESIDSALRSLPPNLATMNSVLPVVYGCVNYDFPFSKGIHQTQFIFTMDLVPVIKGTIEPPNLKIVKFPFGGSWGD
jgi:hypothetical protein